MYSEEICAPPDGFQFGSGQMRASAAVLASISSLLSIPYLLFIIRFTSCIPFNIFLFLFRLYKLDDVCTKQ